MTDRQTMDSAPKGGRPCDTDTFLKGLWLAVERDDCDPMDAWINIGQWLHGEWGAAIEGLNIGTSTVNSAT